MDWEWVGLVDLFPQTAENQSAYPIMLMAWSVTKIIHYSFYAWNIVDEPPYPLVWLRHAPRLLVADGVGTPCFGCCIRLGCGRNFG
jgi:very-long-chain (3R)-3-hydroxyacyl-CoA dehydratase